MKHEAGSKIKYASEAQRGDENKVFIDSIKARGVRDSRGNPTVEVALGNLIFFCSGLGSFGRIQRKIRSRGKASQDCRKKY